MTAFPLLRSGYFLETSPATTGYNCIAWAARDTTRWWWPTPGMYYWPPGVPADETIAAFIAAFGTIGFGPCEDGRHEPGVGKVALFATSGGVPTHMARQLPNGDWTSKLGSDIDIEHDTPEQVSGATYSVVVQFLCR